MATEINVNHNQNLPSFGNSMLSGLGSGLASGGLGLLFGAASSGLNTLINGSWRTHARFQRDMQMQLMDHQAKLNKEQYDYEMQQESPAMQRQRLEAAGMNPALAYGSGAGGSGMSASVGSVSGGSAGMPNPKAMQSVPVSLTDLAAIQNMAAQNESLAAGARKTNADAATAEYELERKKRQDSKGLADYEVDAVKLNNDLVEARIASEQQAAALNRALAETEDLLRQYKFDEAKMRYLTLVEQYDDLIKRNPLEREQIEAARDEAKRRTALMAWQMAEENPQNEYYGALADLTDLQEKRLEELKPYFAQMALNEAEKLKFERDLTEQEVEAIKEQVKIKWRETGIGWVDAIGQIVVGLVKAWLSRRK